MDSCPGIRPCVWWVKGVYWKSASLDCMESSLSVTKSDKEKWSGEGKEEDMDNNGYYQDKIVSHRERYRVCPARTVEEYGDGHWQAANRRRLRKAAG